MDELAYEAQLFADAVAGLGSGPAGRVETAVVASNPMPGEAVGTVGVYLDGGTVAIPARCVGGSTVALVGAVVAVWRSGSRVLVLGSMAGRQPWLPVLNAAGSPTYTARDGWYEVHAGVCTFYGFMTLNAVGTGTYNLLLPVTNALVAYRVFGSCVVFDASAVQYSTQLLLRRNAADANYAEVLYPTAQPIGTLAGLSATTPMTFAAGDQIEYWGSYPV